jgi:hypothetical protein
MKEEDPESRAITAESFSSGKKDYTPKDFIAAVRATSGEAKADTAMAPRVEGDPETAVAGTEAAATPSSHITARHPV